MSLIGLAAYGTILALGVCAGARRRFSTAVFFGGQLGSGGDPYAVVIGDTPNLNHPILLPVLWVFTLMSPPHAFIAWSVLSLGLLVACLPAISRIARIGELDLGRARSGVERWFPDAGLRPGDVSVDGALYRGVVCRAPGRPDEEPALCSGCCRC